MGLKVKQQADPIPLDGSGFYVLFEAEGHVGVVRDVEGFVAVFADAAGAASVVLDEDVV
jgi:hypothetical protein